MTEAGKTRLHSCPFCGGQAMAMGIRDEFWIECTACHINTQSFDTPSEAAAAWNRRTTSPPELAPKEKEPLRLWIPATKPPAAGAPT